MDTGIGQDKHFEKFIISQSKFNHLSMIDLIVTPGLTIIWNLTIVYQYPVEINGKLSMRGGVMSAYFRPSIKDLDISGH